MTKRDFDTFVKRVKFVTAHCAEIVVKGSTFFDPLSPDDDPLMKKAREMSKVLNSSSFGCQQENVRKLFSILLGKEIPIGQKGLRPYFNNDESMFMAYLAVVPMACSNYHSYPLEEVSICKNSARAGVKTDGANGNQFPSWERGDLRLAHQDEIDSWAVEFWEVYGAVPTDLSDWILETNGYLGQSVDVKIAELEGDS